MRVKKNMSAITGFGLLTQNYCKILMINVYKIMNTTDNTKNIGILSNRLSSILKILIIIKISIFILYAAQD